MIRVRERISKYSRLIAIVCRHEKDFYLDYYFDHNGNISVLKFKVPKKEPLIESIFMDFPSADYFEREIHDFFGVEFSGNPNLHLKMFLSDDWNKKPPLLKDDKNA